VSEETIPERPESFYAGAYGRILRVMQVLGVVLTLAALIRFGSEIAAGFAIGCVLAVVNFSWLKRMVSALADRVTDTGGRPGGAAVVMRFLLRYLLVAAAAYVIFKISLASLYGLLAGLFLPVAAIMVEAVFELYVALRRGV